MHKANETQRSPRALQKGTNVGFWDKLFRICMSLMLVTSLVPVTPANANEGEGNESAAAQQDNQDAPEDNSQGNEGTLGGGNKGTHEGEEEGQDEEEDPEGSANNEGTSAGQGGGEAKPSNQENQGAAQQDGEDQKKTPEVTARIVGFKPAENGWTDNEGTLAGGDGFAVVSLSAAFSEETEDSVEITLCAPNGFRDSVVLSREGDSSETLDVRLPQITEGDMKYSFGAGSSDITMSYGTVEDEKVLPDSDADPIPPAEVIVKRPYGVTAYITYDPSDTPTTESLVYANARFEGVGFTKDVVVTYSYVKNGTESPTRQTVMLDAKHDFTATIEGIDTFERVEGAETEFAVASFSASYDCVEEGVSDGKVTVSDYAGIMINGVPEVTGGEVTYNFDGDPVDVGDGKITNKPVKATVLISGTNFTEQNVEQCVRVKWGDDEVAPTYKDPSTLKLENVTLPKLKNGESYPKDYFTVEVNGVSSNVLPNQTTITFDTVAPVVAYKFNKTPVSTESGINYYDIQSDVDELKLTLTAVDSSSGFESGDAFVSWPGKDATKVEFDESGKAEIAFKARDFYDGESSSFVAPEVTFSVTDALGNKRVKTKDGKESLTFACDSYAFSKWPYTLSKTPVEGAIEADDGDAYNGNVGIAFVASQPVPSGIYAYDESSVVINDGRIAPAVASELSTGSYEATIEQDVGKRQDYAVVATLITKHGAQKRFEEKVFAIDTTTPEVSEWIIGEATNSHVSKDSDGVMYFNARQNPTATITITNASTLSTEDFHGLKVTLVDAVDTNESKELNSSEITWTSQDDGNTYKGFVKFKNKSEESTVGCDLVPEKVYALTIEGKTVFGADVEKKTSNGFAQDSIAPQVWAMFSKPVNIINTIATFFRDPEAQDEKSGMGFVTLYVQDTYLNVEKSKEGYTLNDVSISNPTGLNQTEGKWKKTTVNGRDAYALTIPYYNDGDIFAIGEGKSKKLEFSAKDIAGNPSNYVYDTSTNTVIEGEESKERSGESFTIDVRKPKLVNAEVDGGKSIAKENTRINKDVVVVNGEDQMFVKITVDELDLNEGDSKIYYKTYINGVLQKSVTPIVGLEWNTEGKEVDNRYTTTISLPKPSEEYANQEVVYQIGYDLADNSGNGNTGNTDTDYYFAIDDAQPDIKVALSVKPITSNDVDYYDSKGVEATVTVRDAFLDLNSFNLVYMKEDGKTQEAIKLDGELKGEGNDRYYAVALELLESDADVVYAADDFNIAVSDYMGNTANWKYQNGVLVGEEAVSTSNKFVVDGSAPVITIAFEKDYEIVSSSGDTDYYDEETMTAVIEIEDAHFDASDSTLTDNGKGEAVHFKDLGPVSKNGSKYTYIITYDAGSIRHTIGVYAKDIMPNAENAKHVAETSYKHRKNAPEGSAIDQFVLDNNGIKVERVEFDNAPVNKVSEDGNDYFADNLVVTITVSGANFDSQSKISATYGTIDEVGWQQQENGEWTAKVGFEQTPATETADLQFEIWDSLYASSKDEKKEELEKEHKHYCEWKYENENKYVASLEEAYNTSAGAFVVDTDAPKVAVSFSDAPRSENGVDYYKDRVVATITVADSNIKKDDLVALNLGGDTVKSDWTEGEPGVWTKEVEFGEQGLYNPDSVGVKDAVARILSDNNKAADNYAQAEEKTRLHTTEYHYGDNTDLLTSTVAKDKKVNGPQFFIDYEDPKVDVVLNEHYAGTLNDIDYFDTIGTDKMLDVTVTIADISFNPKAVVWDATEAAGGVVQNRETDNGFSRGKNEDEWVAHVKYAETPVDKTYTIAFDVTDFSGRTTSYKYGEAIANTSTFASYKGKHSAVQSKCFVVDVTKPEITVDWGNSVPVNAVKNEDETFTDYYKNIINATIIVKDNNFDTENSGITAISGKAKGSETDWKQVEEDGVKVNQWKKTIQFAENQNKQTAENPKEVASWLALEACDKLYALEMTTDKEDHRNTWNYTDGARTRSGKVTEGKVSAFVVDHTEPNITTEFTGPAKAVNGVATAYNDNKDAKSLKNIGNVKIRVDDKNIDTSSISIIVGERVITPESIKWDIYTEKGETIPSGYVTTIPYHNENPNNKDKESEQKDMEGADPQLSNSESNALTLSITAVDRANISSDYKLDATKIDKKAEDTEKFNIDVESPRFINFSVDGDLKHTDEGVSAEARTTNVYRNDSVTVTVRAEDLNFDINESKIKYTKLVNGAESGMPKVADVQWRNVKKDGYATIQYDGSFKLNFDKEAAKRGTRISYRVSFDLNDTPGNPTRHEDVAGGYYIALDNSQVRFEYELNPKTVAQTLKNIDYYDTRDSDDKRLSITARIYDPWLDVANTKIDYADASGTQRAIDILAGDQHEDKNGSVWYEKTVEFDETDCECVSDIRVTANDLVDTGEIQYAYANYTTTGATQFVVDGTDPALRVELGSSNVLWVGSDGKTDVFAPVDNTEKLVVLAIVDDRHFNPGDKKTTIKPTARGRLLMPEGNVNGWVNDGKNKNIWKATIEYEENDEDKSDLSVNLVDKAMHELAYDYSSNKAKEGKTTVAWEDTEGVAKLVKDLDDTQNFTFDVSVPTIDSITFRKMANGTDSGAIEPKYTSMEENYGTTDVDYYDADTVRVTVTVDDSRIDRESIEFFGHKSTAVERKGGKSVLTFDLKESVDEYDGTARIYMHDTTYNLINNNDAVKSRHEVKWTYNTSEVSGADYGVDATVPVNGDQSKPSRYRGDRIVLDSKAPMISLTIDQKPVQTVSNTEYYSVVPTAMISVSDKRINKNSIEGINKLLSNMAEAFRVSTPVLEVPKTLSGATHYKKYVEFTMKENTATLLKYMLNNYKFVSYDMIGEGNLEDGHSTVVQHPNAIVVDLTDPIVDFSLDQHYAGSLGATDYIDSVTGSSRIATATITLTDISFDLRDFNWNKVLADNENGNRVVEVINADSSTKGWTYDGGDKWTATVTYRETPVHETYSPSLPVKDYALRTTNYIYGAVARQGNSAKTSTNTSYVGERVTVLSGSNFVVDATQPKITVSFGSNVYSTDIYPVNNSRNVYNDSDYYDFSSLVATITVKDNNFDGGNTNVTFGDKQSKVTHLSNWTQSGDTWTAVYRFDENDVDTKNSLAVYTQDLVRKAAVATGRGLVTNHVDEWAYKAGVRNGAAATGANYFVLDHTAPTIRVEMSEAPQQVNYQGTGIDYYAGIAGDALTATVRVNDNNFDPNTNLSQILPIGQFGRVEQSWVQTAGTNEWVARVAYAENSNANTSDLNITAQDFLYTAGSASGNAIGNHSVSYDYGRSNTTAGGVTSQYGDTFILDYTAPTVASVTAITNYSGIYAQAEPLLFYNDSDGSAGLSLDIIDNNGLEKSKIDTPFSLEGATNSINALRSANVVRLLDPASYDVRNELNRNIEYTLEDHAGNYSVWLISPEGKVSLKKTGRVDYRENTLVNDLVQSTHPERLVLDHMAPVLGWSTSVQEGAFYNTTQSITMNVEELNFDYLQQYDSGQVAITVNEYAGKAGRALSQWTRNVGSFSGGGTSWAHTVSFETDGHYVLEGKLTDPANNASRIEFREFTIDKTAPRIVSITYDNNDVRNGKYYKAVRTATITVEEHNWNDALESSFITTNGRIGGWTHSGDTHVATVFFGTDGDYNLSVKITDKAGNTDSKTEPGFTIDLTAPKITFENVTDKTAYGDDIAPHIVFTDEKNFDTNGLQWTLTGAKNGEKKFATSKSLSGNSATVSYGDFDRAVEADDIYTLKAHMVDLAGNEADGSIQFSVNRFGSNFMVRDARQYETNGGYLATAPEVVVDEINVTGAEDKDHGVTVTRGLDTKNLEQQSDKDSSGGGFFIDSALESYGWSHYTYHVGTGNYKSSAYSQTYDDGNYHVAVNSQDKVKNNNNSTNYYDPATHDLNSAEVAFTLDTTAPIVENLHYEEGALFSGDGTKVTFTAIDNIGLDNVSYTVNGNTGSLTQGVTDEYTFDVPVSMFGDTDIAIVARDIAGNYSDGTIEGNASAHPDEALVAAGKVTVRASIWRYVPFIAGGVGVAGITAFILIRRKKNNDKEENAEVVQE